MSFSHASDKESELSEVTTIVSKPFTIAGSPDLPLPARSTLIFSTLKLLVKLPISPPVALSLPVLLAKSIVALIIPKSGFHLDTGVDRNSLGRSRPRR